MADKTKKQPSGFDRLKNLLQTGVSTIGKVYNAGTDAIIQKMIGPQTQPTFTDRVQQPAIDVASRGQQIEPYTVDSFKRDFKEGLQRPAAIPTIKAKTTIGKISSFIPNLAIDTANTVVGQGIVNPTLDVAQNSYRAIMKKEPLHYDELRSAPSRLGYNLAGMGGSDATKDAARSLGTRTNASEVVGNLAGTTLPIAGAYTGGSAVEAQLGENALKNRLINGAITGAKFGGTYGTLSSLDRARGEQLAEQLKQGVIGGFTGAAGGAALGTAIPLVIEGGRAVANDIRRSFTPDPVTGRLPAKPGFMSFPGSDKITNPEDYRTAIKQKLEAGFANMKSNPRPPSNLDGQLITDNNRTLRSMETEYRKNPDAFIEKYKLLPPELVAPPASAPVSLPTQSGSNVIGKTFTSTQSGRSFTPVKIEGDLAIGADGSRVKVSGLNSWVWKEAAPAVNPSERISPTETPIAEPGKLSPQSTKANAGSTSNPSVSSSPNYTPNPTRREVAIGKSLGMTPEEVASAKAELVNRMQPKEPTPAQMETVTAAAKNKKTPQMLTDEDAHFAASTAHGMAQDKKTFNSLFDRWIAKRDVANTTGAETASRFKVPGDMAQQTIADIENGVKTNKYGNDIRAAYDDLYKKAVDLGKSTGQDVAYRQNYLTHVWKDTPQQIESAFQRLGKRFSYANPREIPTYAEGIKMGLTPRYSNPAQMVGDYARKLEQTSANVGFFNDLKNNGYIVPASVGTRQPGFSPIIAEGFPNNSTSYNGQTITGQWYAPTEIASQINRIFNPEDNGNVGKFFRTGAKISGGAQDILLSGGIPKTPLNAFTIAQSTKELLAGRLKSPITSMVRSLNQGTALKFFENNVGTIKKMQERNIPFQSEFSLDNIADQGWVKNTFGDSFGSVWNKTVNTPTFKRFMPMLQVNLFNDIEKGAIKAGKTEQEAADIAAQAVKNFYGLGSTGKAARGSQLGKDVVSTTLFAPRYRESMVNFWVNNVKTLVKNPLALENRSNATFLVGATATLIAMNELNKAINGHGMGENPEGKTDKLLIPLGNGKTIGIPFLSSIATVPRMAYNTVKDVVAGDFKAAGKELEGGLSMAFRPIADVVGNENYFGSEIYNENDTAGDKVKKSANYLLNPVTGAYTHPYLREGIKLAQGKQGVTETLSKATELPIRWYNTESINNAPFWKEYDNQKKIASIISDAKYGKIDQQSAEKQLAKLSGGKVVPDGTVIENSDKGYFAYKTSKGINFADTREEADVAIAKDKLANGDDYETASVGGKVYAKIDDSVKSFDSQDKADLAVAFDKFSKGDENYQEFGNYVFRKDSTGAPTKKTKVSFDTELETAELTSYKKKGDLQNWFKTADAQAKNLQDQLNDPNIDALDKIQLQNKLDSLLSDAEKYAGYGGFTKPKKGKKPKSFSAVNLTGDTIGNTYKNLQRLLDGGSSASASMPHAQKVQLKKYQIKGA